MHKILVVNLGSTSTEVALYEDEEMVFTAKEDYEREKLQEFSRSIDQYDMRLEDVQRILRAESVMLSELSAIASRGGLLKPMESGTYRINAKMAEEIRMGRVMSEHISNVAPLVAFELARKDSIPAFIADPVSVDEFEPLARVSGLPELPRRALQHTLNIKAVARRAAAESGKEIEEMNLVVAHVGGGISVCPVKKGKIVDANNANEEGPFSPERTGGLPSSSLVDLCFSGKNSHSWTKRRIVGQGGLTAYLGTNSTEEVERRIVNGDEDARLVYEAMAYQISKEIGAMATVLRGDVDRIILTGGCAHSHVLTEWIEERVGFIAPISIYPGADELQALAAAALRVVTGQETARTYE